MIFPLKWMLRRPGILLPVFFLSQFPAIAEGQIAIQEASIAALGGAYVARAGFMASSHNQAGLAWIEDHSITLQHSRPFLELGISVIAAQIKGQKGGWGSALSTFGITGLRQTSLWLSYGMRLSPSISAGVGMHFNTFSIPELSFYHPELDLAMGIQARINKHWVLGAHIATARSMESMCISAGFSYSFFETATCYSELHLRSGHRIQVANGIEWSLREKVRLMLGINNLPYTWSAGLAILRKSWVMHLAFQYISGSGTLPHTSFHYVW